jgi:hypothetical protein
MPLWLVSSTQMIFKTLTFQLSMLEDKNSRRSSTSIKFQLVSSNLMFHSESQRKKKLMFQKDQTSTMTKNSNKNQRSTQSNMVCMMDLFKRNLLSR